MASPTPAAGSVLSAFVPARKSIAALALACAAVIGCAPPPPAPERECRFYAWTKATRTTPRLTASFLGWDEPGVPMIAYGEDDWHFFTAPLPPGEHGYLVTDDDGTHVDRYNPQRTYRGDTEVSLARGVDCTVPEATIEAVEATDDGTITVTGTFLAAPHMDDAGKLATIRAVGAAGHVLEAEEASPETGRFVLKGSGFERGKHTFRIEAEDASGAAAVGPEVVAWVRPAAKRWEDGLLYQVVTDRFRGDGGVPLAPPGTPGLRAGGTFDGVRAALESGYFDELGVSAIWISPVYENPTGLLVGRDNQMYEAFHGYWVLKTRAVEPQFGGEEGLRELIRAAHARGIAVLFDFVPNHLHDQNERYVQHAGQGWFNNGPEACVCGIDPGCDWGSRIQDCWFAPYLPDVRWQAEGSMRETLEDLRFWMREYDADGFRLDATPMMPRLASRRMAAVLREEYAPKRGLFSIGEVFTGPGEGGTDTIKYFLGPDGLDAAFDFPLTWAVRSVIASESGGFSDVEDALVYTESAMRGSGSLLGVMVDNHDMSRFLSEATGNGGSDAWFNPAPVPDDPRPYDKLRTALGLVMSLPGLPVLYYGTEVGLAGGSDPDNRRVLPGEEALSAPQRSVLETTRRLGKLRACSAALRSGDRKPFLVAKRTYGFTRVAPEEAAIVMISTEAETAEILPPLAAVPAGTYADAFTGETFPIGGGTAVPVAPMSFRILLPADSPCVAAAGGSP
jgi:glycosidase